MVHLKVLKAAAWGTTTVHRLQTTRKIAQLKEGTGVMFHHHKNAPVINFASSMAMSNAATTFWIARLLMNQTLKTYLIKNSNGT